MAAFNRRELDSLELEGGIAPAAIAIGRREERRETTETPGRRRHGAARRDAGAYRDGRKGRAASVPLRSVAAAAAGAERRKVDCGRNRTRQFWRGRVSTGRLAGTGLVQSLGWKERETHAAAAAALRCRPRRLFQLNFTIQRGRSNR